MGKTGQKIDSRDKEILQTLLQILDEYIKYGGHHHTPIKGVRRLCRKLKNYFK